MKRTSKLLSFAMFALALQPGLSGVVVAQEESTERLRNFSENSTKNTEIRSKLCERYASGRFGSNLESKEGKVKSLLQDRVGDIETKRGEADAKRIEMRLAADAKRQEHYQKLRENATNDEQKAAVEQFVTSVEAAVATRRAAQDLARETYRSGVDTAMANQKADYELAITTLKNATEAAIAKAKASCEAGTASSEVSATLKAELTAAKEAFKAATQGRESLKDIIESLKAARKSAFDASKATFDSELAAAKEALRAALGLTGQSESEI